MGQMILHRETLAYYAWRSDDCIQSWILGSHLVSENIIRWNTAIRAHMYVDVNNSQSSVML